jgi:hypothetical protein
METYTTVQLVHDWVWARDYLGRICSGCALEEVKVSGVWQTYEEAETPNACLQEVVKCVCYKSHSVGHSKCHEAGEHICSPCECDCHYDL